MGKRILPRREGRGTSVFRSPAWKKKGPAKYPSINEPLVEGVVTELIHDPGRGAPLAKIRYKEGTFLTVAAEGMYVGQVIQMGPKAAPANGNILPLSEIPDGTKIFNVELRAGDGGKLARSSGSYCTLVSHVEQGVVVSLPSGSSKVLSSTCLATIGVVAASGRIEKPFLKAGAKYHLMKAKAAKYPRVRGVAMNAVSHPHGGGNHPSVSRSTTVSRRLPPGRKVGHISARRAGRR
ncbi:50S ribosomal protein L2 [Candidatus Marsarchaeota G2 archaeon ECH_B_SAG-F08]|jgi:large subunit ribosomal protein L2|uniref:Large ribosomal subunit protein uL2 n=4 Tax=Candidatus Marsarchaeota TaxID=1978152 RepID=A0A2R6AKA9_9ARCH|nr:MAG: 50S ribosomal protein L2 [Candidatus Marsarchaeota G1 archaeon BE_D]PSN88885.1 MAG: 50S ribosomal protein L2 [Candidatus Marsarchaeota G1 archaeon OSP_C]PSN93327.1 MAG: 50S ribosomal protein L2 [Candidatus Marsarchaeota G1 archaeon OSP_B]PSN97517.1 MAG: 50S ribosomal protein L2 [Candidatus Marsarchaeota G2 archaeon ECH_B_SAG-F08]